jgi:hypothetical protein
LTRRLRGLLERPIGDNERLTAFGLAALLVLAACALLLLTRSHHPAAAHRPNRPAPVPTAPVLPPPATPPPAPAPRPQPRPGRHAPPAAVDRAARRFLAGYLRYLYGRGGARQIEAVSRTLRRRLAAHPPRVSPATRQRRPRITAIIGRGVGARRWALVAQVEDGGVERYPLALQLDRQHGTLVVTRLEGD